MTEQKINLSLVKQDSTSFSIIREANNKNSFPFTDPQPVLINSFKLNALCVLLARHPKAMHRAVNIALLPPSHAEQRNEHSIFNYRVIPFYPKVKYMIFN